MLAKGPAKKVTVIVDEGARWTGRPLYAAILDLVRQKGAARATVTRALAGYSPTEGLVDERQVERAVELPLRIEIVDTADGVEALLPDIYLMVERGLVTVEDVHVVRSSSGGVVPIAGARGKVEKVTMQAKQLSIHISEKDLYNGEPLFEAILKRFNLEEFAGATVYRALEGFGAHHHIHRARLLSLHREAPIVLIMIDTPEHVARARTILDGMLTRGAVTVTDVEATFYGASAEGKPADGAGPTA